MNHKLEAFNTLSQYSTALISNNSEPQVTPAQLSWRADDQGHMVPVSDLFGDVYYSLVDGLAESRYVFIEQNNLPARFEQLFKATTSNNSQPTADTLNFSIAELGFGTGLNVLVTWQLWRDTQQKLKQQTTKNQRNSETLNCENSLAKTDIQTPHLHLISTEKFPLTHADLSRSLKSWQQVDASLTPYIDQLLVLYPTLVAGCHRLHLAPDVTLDLWLGDAANSLQQLGTSQRSSHCQPHHGQPHTNSNPYLNTYIDAWYLDGFAPACNEALWTQQIFAQIARLSTTGTTATTFSSAGVVKRGLASAGFEVNKVKGFGRKREMLTATRTITDCADTLRGDQTNANNSYRNYQHIAVIGCGISGLMSAWALATRGIQVTLIDKQAPLAGGSGNPRALLAPKMTPIGHVAEHLHSMGYLYSQRLYRQLDLLQVNNSANCPAQSPIFEPRGTLDLLIKTNIDVNQIAEYPSEMAQTLRNEQAQKISGLQQDLQYKLYLPQAGLINPRALSDKVLSHPNIDFVQASIEQITPMSANHAQDAPHAPQKVQLTCHSQAPIVADAVVIAAASASKALDERIFEFRKIRGQLSWFKPTAEQLERLPKLPLKYGGYCARFMPTAGDERVNPVHPDTPTFLIGASFVRNDTSTEIRSAEHQVNHNKLITAIPELAEVLTDSSLDGWQARVGIRAQTPDYHPLVGQVDENGLIWTLSGMGSKGYAFAPLCAQALADIMMGRFCALPSALLARLSPKRKTLQKPLTP